MMIPSKQSYYEQKSTVFTSSRVQKIEKKSFDFVYAFDAHVTRSLIIKIESDYWHKENILYQKII